MPTVKKNGATKAKAPKAPAKSAGKPEERPVKYPTRTAVFYDADSEVGPITADLVKEWLGWETESEYAERILRETGAKNASFGTNFHFIDVYGNKVRCRHNAKNRPFDTELSMRLAQEVLHRNWAGPTCFPGETVNGEAFVISRIGEVHNGQKRGAALVFACQKWEQDDHWHEAWPEAPVMESLVVFGVSDREEIIRTIDCAAERTEADMFYTMEIFSKLDPKDRKEASKMSQAAVDLLWKRTKASEQQWTKYKTNTEAKLFSDRHPTLLKCIKHCFEENKERVMQLNLKTTGGNAAGLMYLMAASDSNGEDYRSAEPRTEDGLNFDNYDKASDFWALAGKGAGFEPLVEAISKLVDDHAGVDEKLALIWKAWEAWKANGEVTSEDLVLKYQTNADGSFKLRPNGRKILEEFADFGGIDATGDGGTVTPQDRNESANGQAEASTHRAASDTSANEAKAKANAMTERLAKLHEEHPGKILLFKSKSTPLYRAFNGDCAPIRAVLDIPIQDYDGQEFVSVAPNRLDHLVKKLTAAGREVAICEEGSSPGDTKVTDALASAAPATPAKRKGPQPKGKK